MVLYTVCVRRRTIGNERWKDEINGTLYSWCWRRVVHDVKELRAEWQWSAKLGYPNISSWNLCFANVEKEGKIAF